MSTVYDSGVERPELGFLLTRLLREVMAREEPLLATAGLHMWDYAVLGALDGGDAPTQAQLAATTGRDKTRLIGNLDRLEELGLVQRAPDPADRRNRVVSLTTEGRRVLGQCRVAIRAMEDELLAGLGATERAAFERVLVRLVAPG
jgi:DNA-binding MarR family transcriptional regulator